MGFFLYYSCKGLPEQLLLSWSCDPPVPCSQDRLGKPGGPAEGEEWLHKTISYHHGAQQRCCPQEEGCKDLYSLRCWEMGLLIPPGSIRQGGKGINEEPWSFAIYKILSMLSFPALASAPSSPKHLCVACSKKCNIWSTAKSGINLGVLM